MRAVKFSITALAIALSLLLPSEASAQSYGSDASGKYSWSGWYLGFNGGWGRRDANDYPSTSYYNNLGATFGGASGGTSDPYGVSTSGTGASTSGNGSTDRSRHSGFSAGATLGYQYQFNWLVMGVEYDLQYADLGDKPGLTTASFTKGGGGTSYTAGNIDATDGDGNRFLGLLRFRSGVAVDRWLVFATGGPAYRFSYSSYDPYVANSDGTVTTFTNINKANPWGWSVGGGAEYAVNNWMSLKAEYLHLSFNKASYIDPIASTVTGAAVIYKYDRDIDLVRLGLNFRFNFGAPSKY